MDVIVAVDENWAIGQNNGLLFTLPTDMKRFRAMTNGCTVIVGRMTLDSFPGGKPLPNRRNIVITRNPEFQREGCEVVSSPEEAVRLAKDDETVWVIGGASVYASLLPMCKKAYVTRVNAKASGASSFFPNLDKLPSWKLVSTEEPITEENGLSFCFTEYENVRL